MSTDSVNIVKSLALVAVVSVLAFVFVGYAYTQSEERRHDAERAHADRALVLEALTAAIARQDQERIASRSRIDRFLSQQKTQMETQQTAVGILQQLAIAAEKQVVGLEGLAANNEERTRAVIKVLSEPVKEEAE